MLFMLFFIISPLSAFAYPDFLKRLPNGAQLPLVGLGHVDVNGGGQLNQFGRDFIHFGMFPHAPSCNLFTHLFFRRNGVDASIL
jgi:hypothetical protein